MDNSIIKLMLENRTTRVYSLIVQMYFEKIEVHKASVFKIWLARELNIAPELIHESSISAALARHRKRLARSTPAQANQNVSAKTPPANNDFDTDIPDVFPGFK